MLVRLVAAATFAMTVLAAAPVVAQQAAPADAAAAPDTPPLSSVQPSWVKSCQKDEKAHVELCQISRDLRAETGQTVASVSLREQKTDKAVKWGLVIAVPPGMQIQPGVRVLIDQQQAVVGKYSVCFTSACFVDAEVSDAVMASLRKGTTLNLQVISPKNTGILLPIGLDSFVKTLEGDAFDPTKVPAAEKQVGDTIRERFKCAANPSGC